VLVFRSVSVYGDVLKAGVYYSTSDIKAYQAGEWLKNNYPNQATVVVTDVPGFWFRIYSGKNVIAATNPIIERNLISESVLDLSYEMENPLTLIRAYEAKKAISDENYVSINDVWKRVSFSSSDGDFLFYQIEGVNKKICLSNVSREITFEEDLASQRKLTIQYSNDEITVSQTILIQNNSYPTNVTWSLIPHKSQVTNVTLYLSTFLDLQFSFDKAYLPGILNWENPWSKPSATHGTDWAVTDFSQYNLTEKYVGLYDEKNQLFFAMKFENSPTWGNIGALASMQINAIRFQYNVDKIDANQTTSFAYQTLTFSKNSYPEIQQPSELKNLFQSTPPGTFEIKSRDYHDYIKENNVVFIVFDKNQLDISIVRCKLLELIYSNDRYVIFKIRSSG
jgi:hypothetical protein